MYADEDEDWYQDFRILFVGRSKEQAILNQFHFFTQRMGGPPLYTQNRADDAYGGHPALRARHRFTVNARGAQRWMYHMENAMLAQGFVEGEKTYEALHEFFAEVAQFLRNDQH